MHLPLPSIHAIMLAVDSELHTALDVLSDMVMNPVFPKDE